MSASLSSAVSRRGTEITVSAPHSAVKACPQRGYLFKLAVSAAQNLAAPMAGGDRADRPRCRWQAGQPETTSATDQRSGRQRTRTGIRSEIRTNGRVRGALPALGQLKVPATIPHSDRLGKEFRHRLVCAAGRPDCAQVSRCIGLSGSDRKFPALTGRWGTQRARRPLRPELAAVRAVDRRLSQLQQGVGDRLCPWLSGAVAVLGYCTGPSPISLA